MDIKIRAASTLTMLVGLASGSCSSNGSMTPDKTRIGLSQSKTADDRNELGPETANQPTPTPTARLSCDVRPDRGGNSEEHICVGSWGVGDDPRDVGQVTSDCTALGGVIGKSCDPAGVVAGCRGDVTSASAHITFTYWYYSGTVEHVQAGCADPMQVVFTDSGSPGVTLL
jgi:hypothetical protein